MNDRQVLLAGQWVNSGDAEWDRMWAALAERYPGLDPTGERCQECCSCCGECWQYHGTTRHTFEEIPELNAMGIRSPLQGKITDEGFYHCFRHRHSPTTGERTYEWIRDQRPDPRRQH